MTGTGEGEGTMRSFSFNRWGPRAFEDVDPKFITDVAGGVLGEGADLFGARGGGEASGEDSKVEVTATGGSGREVDGDGAGNSFGVDDLMPFFNDRDRILSSAVCFDDDRRTAGAGAGIESSATG